MRLRTATLFAAITQLLAVLCMAVSNIRSLTELIKGPMKWNDNWMYLLSMPVYLLSQIALTVFLFNLVVKQNKN